MNKQKNDKKPSLTKLDYSLLISGLTATTLLATYLADTAFNGHLDNIVIEVVLYIAIVIIYILTFLYKRSNSWLLTIARTISVAGILAAISLALFIIYFILTFRW